MPPNEVALTIDGTVSLADYIAILVRFQRLLDTLADELAPGVPIVWRMLAQPAWGATS